MTTKRQFENVWAIILGGSSGFGFASVKKLIKHGMNVAVLYRETAHMDKELKVKFQNLESSNNVQILPLNINALEEDGRKNFLQKFKEANTKKKCVRLLLHSVARGNLKPLIGKSNTKTEDILSTEDIRFTTYAMSSSLLDWARMIFEENLFCDDARIIGLTSEGAHKYWESYAAVSIAKSSLESLASYMAVEFAKYGLRTNLIQAGITSTPSLRKIEGSEKLIEIAQKTNPFKRITQPADVANVVYLLCADEAAWINGAVLHVDGGEHCR